MTDSEILQARVKELEKRLGIAADDENGTGDYDDELAKIRRHREEQINEERRPR